MTRVTSHEIICEGCNAFASGFSRSEAREDARERKFARRKINGEWVDLCGYCDGVRARSTPTQAQGDEMKFYRRVVEMWAWLLLAAVEISTWPPASSASSQSWPHWISVASVMFAIVMWFVSSLRMLAEAEALWFNEERNNSS
jgi:hypothetical protein